MDRIKSLDHHGTKDYITTDDGKRKFRKEKDLNTANPILRTKASAAWLNDVQEEIVSIIESEKILPQQGVEQLGDAISNKIKRSEQKLKQEIENLKTKINKIETKATDDTSYLNHRIDSSDEFLRHFTFKSIDDESPFWNLNWKGKGTITGLGNLLLTTLNLEQGTSSSDEVNFHDGFPLAYPNSWSSSDATKSVEYETKVMGGHGIVNGKKEPMEFNNRTNSLSISGLKTDIKNKVQVNIVTVVTNTYKNWLSN